MIRTISMKLAGLGLATALSLSPAYAQTKTLTISWWGFNGDKLEQMVLKPFRAQCGCELVFETGNNADRLNKIKIRGGSGVDVVYLSDSFSQIGVKEGLFQPVDRAKLPNLNGIYELARAPQGPYGPAYTIGRIGIIYDSAKVTTPITSWKDLWREDFRRGLSLPGITTTAGPMTVLIAGAQAGVDPYANPKAAFAALAKLKPNVVKNYNTGSELVNLFAQKEIVIAAAQDFVFANIKAAIPTAQWAELKEGPFANMNTINIVAGSKHVDLAHEFINFHLSPEVQKTMAVLKVDAPVNKKVELTPEQAAIWTYGEATIQKLRKPDYAKLNEVKQDWTDRWNELFGR